MEWVLTGKQSGLVVAVRVLVMVLVAWLGGCAGAVGNVDSDGWPERLLC